MNFYTNITRWGNQLLLREVINGQRINRKVKYSPTLYCPVQKPTQYRTLDGKYVTPIKHQTMKEANEWIDNYKSQPDLVYGNTLYQYSYIAEQYPNRVEWDIEKLLIVTIDIEVAAESGFPNVFECAEELLAITLQDYTTKQIICFASRPFNNTRKDVKYIQCKEQIEQQRCL